MIFVALALLIGTAFYFDGEIMQDISDIRHPVADNFFLGLSYVSSYVIIFLFLTALFLWTQSKRKWLMPLWLSLALSVIIGFFLKIMIERSRPFQQGLIATFDILKDPNFISWNFSLPSVQTMLVFAAIPIISKNFPRFKYLWVLLAGLIALSRFYLGLHFLSDVLIGGVIGYGIGWFIVKKEHENGFWEKSYNRILRR